MVILLSSLLGAINKQKIHVLLFWTTHPEQCAEEKDIPQAEAAAFLDP